MTKNIEFGLAIASGTGNPKELERYLHEALDSSIQAVELSFTRVSKIRDSITPEAVSLFSKFKYKSIHFPVKNEANETIMYPNNISEEEIGKIDNLLEKVSVDTLVIHPDQITDSDWLVNKYGRLLAFENLDIKKSFGKTVDQMEEVFKRYPDTKFVFDLNHVYTNDQSMESAKNFFDKFETRMAHYHFSGYGGFHSPLCQSKEDIILKGLISLKYPVIHEGNLLQKRLLKEERDYISSRLQ
jgi:hypothetical protein